MTDHPTDFFWEASAAARTHGDVAAGTMMGLPCLRVSGAFIAACDHRSGDLIVKLPRHRVQQLIATGAGKPFAPAGKTFREWLLVEDRDPARWAMLIDEARTYASRVRLLPAHGQRIPADAHFSPRHSRANRVGEMALRLPARQIRSVTCPDVCAARIAPVLVDRAQSLVEAGTVPDLDVRRACEARRAGQMISLSRAARPGADGQGLPHLPNSDVG